LEGTRFGWWGEGVWGVGWLATKGMTPPISMNSNNFIIRVFVGGQVLNLVF
jgi:hypothetical protein